MSQVYIRKAAKGSPAAMQALYEEHKRPVLYLCQSLLCDSEGAQRATAHTFKSVFEELSAGRLLVNGDFGSLLIYKAVIHCKSRALKKNGRAFRVPAGANFASGSYDAEKLELTGSTLEILLRNLPVFHRFIYVTHAVAGYSAVDIARIFNTSPKAITAALEAEELNLRRIATAAALCEAADTEYFHSELEAAVATMEVPAVLDATVQTGIRDICTPIQKARRRKRLNFCAMVGAVLLVAAVGICMVGNGSDGTLEDGTLTSSDGSDTAGGTSTDGTDTSTAVDILSCYADITVEGYGTITVALDGNAAPVTVSNFVSLAEGGFYDGLTFHRAQDGFVLQGGDPSGDGTGGSETAITGEFSANGIENSLTHTRGAISMARSSDSYDSATSQFFIVQEDSAAASLDGLYACFGYVTEGMDIVDTIMANAEPIDSMGLLSADAQPVITSITIRQADET